MSAAIDMSIDTTLPLLRGVADAVSHELRCAHESFELDEIGDVYCKDCGEDFTD